MFGACSLDVAARAPRRLAVALALAVAPGAAAQDLAGAIQWRGAGPQVMPALGAAGAAATVARLADDGPVHVVIQLDRIPDAALRQQLADLGVQMQAPLGGAAYFALLSPAQLDQQALAATGAVRSAAAIVPEHKLDPALRAGDLPGHSVIDVGHGSEAVLYVQFHGDVHLDDAARLVGEAGGRVHSAMRSINALVVILPPARIGALADRDPVQWIEPALPVLSEVNDSNRAATGADVVQDPPYNLDGTGVNVMIYDGGSALSSHVDFGGRLTTHDGTGLSNHATHVSGTVGGDGTASGGQWRGMAPNCTLLSYGFQWTQLPFFWADPGDIEQDVSNAVNQNGAVLFNASLGSNVETNGFDCDIQGNYGLASELIDAIVRGSLGEPFRMIWAGGNERQGSGCDIEGFGDYYSIAPPAGAKNHVTVGALNSNNNSMTSFSSWGPTDDGRIKPDVAAPGCQSNGDGGVTSTSSSGGYTTLCGTSMASPTTCGLVALLMQDLRAQFPGQPDPRNSTVKVLLANSALDLGNTGPDYQFGYGLVQIEDAIELARSGRFGENQITHGETVSFDVQVDPGTPELRVTLAWDDVPGTPNVDPALVNDLDLVAVGPDGTHLPWTLDPLNPGAAAVQSQADHINNIEQVFVDNPVAGAWTVEVTGFNVPDGPQPFSLAGDGASNVGLFVTVAGALPELVAPGEATDVTLQVVAIGEELVGGSPTLHYRFDGGSFIDQPLTPAGGDLYEGTIPAVSCGDVPEFYFSAEGTESGVVTSPADAPATTFGFDVGVETTHFSDDFEMDQGWTVSVSPGLTDGQWERGVPIGGGDRGDPPTDADGSGQCYLTDNVDGNSDVDDGTTTLTSPDLDASEPAAVLSYWRWYSNSFGADPHNDVFVVEISDDGGASWATLEVVGPAAESDGGWFFKEFVVADVPGISNSAQLRVRFAASDLNNPSVVEAGVDGVMITSIGCDDGQPPCPWDLDGDGMVGVNDLIALLGVWGSDPGGPPDFDGDGNVGVNDLIELLGNWGVCP